MTWHGSSKCELQVLRKFRLNFAAECVESIRGRSTRCSSKCVAHHHLCPPRVCMCVCHVVCMLMYMCMRLMCLPCQVIVRRRHPFVCISHVNHISSTGIAHTAAHFRHVLHHTHLMSHQRISPHHALFDMHMRPYAPCSSHVQVSQSSTCVPLPHIGTSICVHTVVACCCVAVVFIPITCSNIPSPRCNQVSTHAQA